MDYGLKASSLRETAEQVRTRAAAIAHDETKEILMRLASNYEQLAADYDKIAAIKIPN